MEPCDSHSSSQTYVANALSAEPSPKSHRTDLEASTFYSSIEENL